MNKQSMSQIIGEYKEICQKWDGLYKNLKSERDFYHWLCVQNGVITYNE